MNREQLKNAAAQFYHNKIEFFYQVTESPGFGNYGITGFIQIPNKRCKLRIRFALSFFIRTELPDKGIVNNICTAEICRFCIDNCILPRGPDRIAFALSEKIAFCLKMSDFAQRNRDLEQVRSEK